MVTILPLGVVESKKTEEKKSGLASFAGLGAWENQLVSLGKIKYSADNRGQYRLDSVFPFAWR